MWWKIIKIIIIIHNKIGNLKKSNLPLVNLKRPLIKNNLVISGNFLIKIIFQMKI